MKRVAYLAIASFSLTEMLEAIPPAQVACKGVSVIVTTRSPSPFNLTRGKNWCFLRGFTSNEGSTQCFKTLLTSPLSRGLQKTSAEGLDIAAREAEPPGRRQSRF